MNGRPSFSRLFDERGFSVAGIMLCHTLFSELRAWEQHLQSRLPQIRLLGEFDLTEDETRYIGLLLHTLIKALGPKHAEFMLQDEFPCLFAAFLVFCGIHGDSHKGFWSSVERLTGLPNTSKLSQRWGQLFLTILDEKLSLPTSSFAGPRYVGTMRGHAGLSAEALPELFALIHSAHDHPHLTLLPTAELIGIWKHRHSVPRSLGHFFTFGGSWAESFVERCRHMARLVASAPYCTAAQLSARVGLRREVVESYLAWRAGREPLLWDKRRLRAPYLAFDPWDRGVHICLPAQPLPRGTFAVWKLLMGNTFHLALAEDRAQHDMATRSPSRRVPLVSDEPCVVQLIVDGECVGRWHLLTPSLPWLAFDAATGRQIPWPQELPEKPIWFLYRSKVWLHASPGYAVPARQELPPLPGPWRSWYALELVLKGIRTLFVHSPRGTFPLHVRSAARRPKRRSRFHRAKGPADAPSTPQWRLMWRTPSGRVVTSRWQESPYSLVLSSFEEKRLPFLTVELPRELAASQAQLHILTPENRVVRTLHPLAPWFNPLRRHVGLYPIREEMQRNAWPYLKAHLVLHTGKETSPITRHVATVRRCPRVEEVQLVAHQRGAYVHLTVTWKPASAMKRCVLYLWPRTRPWVSPLRLTLPVEARGRHTFVLPAHLMRPGQYGVAFDVQGARGTPERLLALVRAAHSCFAGDVRSYVNSMPSGWSVEHGCERFLLHLVQGDRERANEERALLLDKVRGAERLPARDLIVVLVTLLWAGLRAEEKTTLLNGERARALIAAYARHRTSPWLRHLFAALAQRHFLGQPFAPHVRQMVQILVAGR